MAPTRARRALVDGFHTLASGRPFRTFNVVEDLTPECHAIDVGHSLGSYVTPCSTPPRRSMGTPACLSVTTVPSLRGRALNQCTYQDGVRLHFIEPGRPVQNAMIESFNVRFRDEVLEPASICGSARCARRQRGVAHCLQLGTTAA